MTVPFNFATQSGNIPLSELDANFANVSAHTLTATYVTGNNQPNITNVGALNSLSVYGNVAAGNITTNGIVRGNLLIGVNYTGTNVSVTGNITSNNISVNGTIEFGNLTVPGNVVGGNLITTGYVTAVGNIIGANVETVNLSVNHIYSDDSMYVTVEDGLEIHGELISESLEVTGNSIVNNLTVTGNFIGTDIQVNSIVNGSSNVDITNLNGNVTVGVNGVNNVLVVTSTGANVAGTIAATVLQTPALVVSNIRSDDSSVVAVQDGLEVYGNVLVNGNISGYNLVINSIASTDSSLVTIEDGVSIHGEIDVIGNISATGNVIAANVNSTTISVTGNIIGANVETTNLVVNSIYTDDSTVVAIRDGVEIYGDTKVNGDINVSSDVSAAGNIRGGNVETVNLVVGNISSDGSTALTVLNDLSVHSDVDVIGDIAATGTIVGGVLTAIGNITGNNIILSGVLTGTGASPAPSINGFSSINSITASASGNITAGNVLTDGVVTATGNITGGNLVVPNGRRIIGDFSSGTSAGRSVFQTSTANGNTFINAIPNGTGTIAAFSAYNSTDLGNLSFLTIQASANAVSLRSSKFGTSAFLPMLIETSNVTRVTVDINGNVGIANTVPVDTLSVGGNAFVNGIKTDNYYYANGTPISFAGTYGNANVVSLMAAFGNNSISTSGNVTTGNLVVPNGQRIIGDFSSGASAGRTLFQTSTSNSSTFINAIPNGTGTIAAFSAYNTSDTTNPSFLTIQASANAVSLRSSRLGTGVFLPMLIETSNVTRVTVDINGNVGIANTTPVDTLSVGGNAFVTGKVTTLPTALANLTAVAGARAFVNNANLAAAANFGAVVGSGGSNVVPVWSDGSNWYIG